MVPRIVPVKDWASASEAAAARTATTASFFMAAPFDAELMARTRAGDQGSWTLLIFSGLGVNRGIDPKGIFRVQRIGDLFLPALSRKLPLVYQAIINGARPDLLRRAPGKGVGRGGRALALELASLRLRARGQSFLRRRASERRQR